MDFVPTKRDIREMINMLSTMDDYDITETCLKEVPCSIRPEFTNDGVLIRKLFIGNLADRTSSKDLENVFSSYGKVECCYLKRIKGKSNFAFVTFANSADALNLREAAYKRAIRVDCRDLRISPADSWHQPDSPENLRKYLSNQDMACDEKPQEEGTNEDSPINVLNDDCLTEIFLCLPIADRIRMERVCKRWQAVGRESWRAVTRLDLSSASWGLSTKIRKRSVDTPALRKILLRCGRSLNHIDFSHPHDLGSSAMTMVGKFCPNLRTIDISQMSLSQAGIRSLLQNCANITKFTMQHLTGPCEKDLSQFFAANKKLKLLQITGCYHITGKCLSHLPCETMEEIHLHNGISLSPSHVNAAIQRCDMLRTLSMTYCLCLDDSTFQAISTRKTLTTLRFLDEFPIASAVGMQQITQLVNLTSLTIRRNYLLTDTFLHLLAENCGRLSHLDIYACTSVTNEGLSSVATLPKLQHLVISHVTSITDEALAGMNNLRTLECHRCVTLEDTGISSLIEMAPYLQLLDLSGCHITNSTLEVAIRATKRRSNDTILKIIVGDTRTNLAEIKEVSPLLQIVNVSLDRNETRSAFPLILYHN